MVVAGLVAFAMPGYAEDQPTVAKLKADAGKLVKMTSGDKQKTQSIANLLISVIKSAKLTKSKTLRKLTSYPRRRTSWRKN